MLKDSQKRETEVKFVNESRPVAVGYTKLANVDPESDSKRVKFDLVIQKTSAGDFDEQGDIELTEIPIPLISFFHSVCSKFGRGRC